MKLHNKALEDFYSLSIFETLESTNDEAFKYDTHKHWLVAYAQSKGRGTRGRVWQSPPGNLYCSLLLSKDYQLNDILAINYIAGLSLMDTIQYFGQKNHIDLSHISLKWPNDIIYDHSKLAGILLEVKGEKLVVGLGLNVAHKLELPAYSTTSLHELGINCDIADFFHMLSYYWLVNYDMLPYKDKIRQKWLSYNLLVGKKIYVKYGEEVIESVFETIDNNFNCILRLTNNQILSINTGEILLKQ